MGMDSGMTRHDMFCDEDHLSDLPGSLHFPATHSKEQSRNDVHRFIPDSSRFSMIQLDSSRFWMNHDDST